ncbi:hypothetical protein GWI33_021789 [Rhynchophorus ferrugineus]|uniref:Uncharacterized protein n=1 Tax=Rhynchophorus ferrugineus TaxID=354439 RepID=A0A834M334_RHYFE|nr:hypothetical protein GWI33_021790 [Rhynchophorus ferrugineus]KAF7264975.1 hypothetical protein GWI33_021789 [Rhynchophorus ferrugineus]
MATNCVLLPMRPGKNSAHSPTRRTPPDGPDPSSLLPRAFVRIAGLRKSDDLDLGVSPELDGWAAKQGAIATTSSKPEPDREPPI